VDAGANIKVISDILGHRSSSSTSIYVRVALRRLRTVALPVPR
jgi:site-specific recombinase XerD